VDEGKRRERMEIGRAWVLIEKMTSGKGALLW
jgi:hypothetical protein